jgi:hypothetical protein
MFVVFFTGRKEFHGPEHIAVVCESQVLHPQLLRPVAETGRRNSGILEGKVRMDMEVGKIGHDNLSYPVFHGNSTAV